MGKTKWVKLDKISKISLQKALNMYNFRNASQELATEMLKEPGNEKMPAKNLKMKTSPS